MPYPEQETAARNIRAAFLQKPLRYAMLIARCQAGKTGAFQELIRLMLLNGDINRAYILCGSNEKELRSQAHADTAAANPAAYAAGEIEVFFRQDFKGAKMDVTRALIVIDESHMDQTQKQELDQFMGAHGLSMDGNPKTLDEKDAYIVSVDATPYSELSALMYKESHGKHIEQLAVGVGYFGLQDYFFGKHIQPTYDISTKPLSFGTMARSAGRKYGLMRLTMGKHAQQQEAAAVAAYKRIGGKVYYYTADKTEIAITGVQKNELKLASCLEDVPAVPTLIIIRGRLRAGKVVPKQHVAYIWEGAKVSKTDSLVQGLPGRMCGYDFGDVEGQPIVRPTLFIPQSALTRHENKVVKASEIERAIMEYPLALPTTGTNLKKGHIAARAANGKTQCPPLRLTWDAEGDDWSFTEKFEKKFSRGEDRVIIQERCYALLLENLEAIRNSPNYSAKQKQEILEQIVPAGAGHAHIRNLQGTSQEAYFKHLREAHDAGTAPSEHISQQDSLNFVITYRGYKAPHANHRHLYVIFYTDATGGTSPSMMAVDLKSRIPQTNGKSIFSIHEQQVDRPLVAGGVVGLDETKIKTPELLEGALREYLRLYRESALTVSRCIQSNKERFCLSKAAFNYVSPKQNDVAMMCAELGREFGVKMKITYARSSAGTFNLKKIEW